MQIISYETAAVIYLLRGISIKIIPIYFFGYSVLTQSVI